MSSKLLLTTKTANSSIPAMAASVGYTVQTFGFGVPTIGFDWFDFNLLAVTPIAGQSVQHSDSIYLPGPSGDQFGGTICSAKRVGGTWTGIAFGGGFYVEAVIAFSPVITGTPGKLPFPAFWSDDINFLMSNPLQWPGQAAGFWHWAELDFMQWPHNTLAYYDSNNLIDWYGPGPSSQLSLPTNGETKIAVPFNSPNRYGCLWVPATTISRGYVQSYLNGVQVFPALAEKTISWDKYSAANPPPPVRGTTGGSVLDIQHMALICGTDVLCPMTIYSCKVWQASNANNLIQ
jgi:hypothetical protein